MRGSRPIEDPGYRRRTPINLVATLTAVLAVVLTGCKSLMQPAATPTPTPAAASLLPTPPHVERGSVDQLYDAAGPFLHTSGDLEVITFRCTIIEGTFCWFGQNTQDGPVPADLARQVVDQVGAKAIENANRNEVSIECSRPIGGGVSLCEIDWGWGKGREPLPLE
jgi:hypothetical protein